MQIIQQNQVLHQQVYFDTPVNIPKLEIAFFLALQTVPLLHCGGSPWKIFWSSNTLTLPAQLTKDWGALKKKIVFFPFSGYAFCQTRIPNR